MKTSDNITFTLSAKGGVAPWTWIDHPFGTVGVFVDVETNLPSNAFYLIPGQDRTGGRSTFQVLVTMLTTGDKWCS
jgi:beta-mannosidase